MSGRLPDIDGKSWANTELVFAQEVEMTNGGAVHLLPHCVLVMYQRTRTHWPYHPPWPSAVSSLKPLRVSPLYTPKMLKLSFHGIQGATLPSGRWAMIGFSAAVLLESITGYGIIGQFIIYGQATGILGEDSGIYLPY